MILIRGKNKLLGKLRSGGEPSPLVVLGAKIVEGDVVADQDAAISLSL